MKLPNLSHVNHPIPLIWRAARTHHKGHPSWYMFTTGLLEVESFRLLLEGCLPVYHISTRKFANILGLVKILDQGRP
jgi:hypothetical protein